MLISSLFLASCKDEPIEPINDNPGLKVGDQVDDFVMEGSDGKMVSLSDFQGKTVLLEFWASWCSYCNAEAPKLNTLYSDFENQDFEILGVSIDEDRTSWINGIQKHNSQYTHVIDTRGFNAPLVVYYDIKTIPKMILLNGDGKVLLITSKTDKVREFMTQNLK